MTKAQKQNRAALAAISQVGLTLAGIDRGYRKAKRTPGERYRRRKHRRDLQRNAWRSFFEQEKRARVA